MVYIFIPDIEPQRAVKWLDNKRLWKQVLEAGQIADIIENKATSDGTKKGFSNHPIVKMYEGCAPFVRWYANLCIDEWVSRGFKSSKQKTVLTHVNVPWFVGMYPRMMADRASLIRKKSDWYKGKTIDFDGRKCVFDVDEKYMDHGYIWMSKLAPAQTHTLGTTQCIDDVDQIPTVVVNPIDYCAKLTVESMMKTFCCAIIKSGARKGLQCQNNARTNSSYCGTHS
jgi:hypothetical protein